jgi:hypothetical protein
MKTQTKVAPTDTRSDAEKERGLLYRAMSVQVIPEANAMARADGTVDDRIPIALSSEAGVERYDWTDGEYYLEILDHSAGAVDLSYATDGLPFLLNHETDEQIGLIEDVSVDSDRRLRGMVRFSRAVRAQEIKQDIVDGIRKKISVGYRQSSEYEQKEVGGQIERRYRGWMPMEGSSVPIPADYSVGVGRSASGAASRKNTEAPATAATAKGLQMPDEQTAAEREAATTQLRVVERKNERTRAETIINLATEHGFSARAAEWVASEKSVEEVSREILTGVKERMKKPTPAGLPVELNEKERKRYSFARAIAAESGITEVKFDAGFEREIGQEVEKKLPQEYKRRGGVLIPSTLSSRTLDEALSFRAGLDSATSTKGTELKFTQPGDFIDLLRARMKTRALGARILSGLTGPVSFIKQTGAASGSWLAENGGADTADSNLLLALVTLAIKTYQASTSFSRQLLVSAISGSVDAEQMVRDDLALVHAIALDSAGINGTGAANQPRGVLNTAGIGAEVGGTNGAAASYANVVNMETTVGVANADVETMAYLTNPQQRGKLKQIAQLANTANIPVWHDGEVNGYRAEVSTQVPANLTKGTSVGICSAIILGDWSQLIYGEWGVLELITDPFRLKKQGMIEVTSFQMADVGIRIPAAFAAMQDAL